MDFLQTSIQVEDMERSIEFYRDYMGLKIQERFGGPEREIAFLAAESGTTAVELIYVPNAKKFQGQGISLGFGVDNLDKAREKAKEMNLEPGDVISPNPQIKFFFVKDPNGVPIQICQKL